MAEYESVPAYLEHVRATQSPEQAEKSARALGEALGNLGRNMDKALEPLTQAAQAASKIIGEAFRPASGGLIQSLREASEQGRFNTGGVSGFIRPARKPFVSDEAGLLEETFLSEIQQARLRLAQTSTEVSIGVDFADSPELSQFVAELESVKERLEMAIGEQITSPASEIRRATDWDEVAGRSFNGAELYQWQFENAQHRERWASQIIGAVAHTELAVGTVAIDLDTGYRWVVTAIALQGPHVPAQVTWNRLANEPNPEYYRAPRPAPAIRQAQPEPVITSTPAGPRHTQARNWEENLDRLVMGMPSRRDFERLVLGNFDQRFSERPAQKAKPDQAKSKPKTAPVSAKSDRLIILDDEAI